MTSSKNKSKSVKADATVDPAIKKRDSGIRAARRQGKTYREIADQFGLSFERVRQICKRYGVKQAWPMRQCSLPGCGIAFYPARAWQKFHNSNCAAKDRMRRWSERYRKLAAAAAKKGQITTTAISRRKVVRLSGSREREITKAEANILDKIRQIGQPAMDMVAGMLNGNGSGNGGGPTRIRSPESVGGDGRLPPNKRIRNIQNVHPRSLEKT